MCIQVMAIDWRAMGDGCANAVLRWCWMRCLDDDSLDEEGIVAFDWSGLIGNS